MIAFFLGNIHNDSTIRRMKKYHTLLAYYSLIISTLLIVWSTIFVSKHSGYILALLILPISVYFWILVTGKLPHAHSEDSAPDSSRAIFTFLLTIAFIIGSASIVLYIVVLGLQPKSSQQTQTLPDLTKLEKQMQSIKHNNELLEKVVIKLDILETNINKLDVETSIPTSSPEASMEARIKELLKTSN